jgi:hypothetical protein
MERKRLQRVRNRKLFSDVPQQVIDALGAVVTFAFGFYAIRLLTSFRMGMLEKGWKHVAYGGISLIVAQFVLLASEFGSPTLEVTLGDIGTLARFTGMVFISLGLRAHYQVWRLDNKDVAPTPQSRHSIEN